MKATSIRLEVFVKLSLEELKKLKHGSLIGKLKFYDDPSPPKNIPIEIIYDSKQEKLLKVETEPEGNYFDEVKNIRFRINKEYYYFVDNRGVFSYRFNTGGKLMMILGERHTHY